MYFIRHFQFSILNFKLTMRRLLFSTIIVLLLSACTPSSPTQTTKPATDRPNLIVWAQTTCPHCQKFIPEVETLLNHYPQVSVFVNVLDNKQFSTKLPQGNRPELNYANFTGHSCLSVPAWVIIDNDGKLLDFSCGGSKGIETIKNTLNKL